MYDYIVRMFNYSIRTFEQSTLFLNYQNNPVICPCSSISMFSAAGLSGNPGIRMISPVIGITNPAHEAISI